MNGLVRFSPTTEMRRLQREIDRLFEGLTPSRNAEGNEHETAVWAPRVDLAETEDAYLIHLDVPGLSKEQLEINLHEGVLTVSGNRKVEETEEKRNYVRVERQYGQFYRSFTLPKAVTSDNIEANYKDGVLNIRVPKAEESKPRRIEIS